MNPSKDMLKLYMAVRSRKGYVTAPQLMQHCGTTSTVTRRTLRRWHMEGLLSRTRHGYNFLYRWTPSAKAQATIRVLEAAAPEIRRGAKAAVNPAAQALRALARLLAAAARSIEDQP